METFNDDKRIDNLIISLGDRNRSTRIKAEDVLIHMGEPVVMPLIHAIENNVFEYHQLPYAIRVLGRVRDRRTIGFLIDRLTSNHVHVVQEAIEALKLLGDPQAISPLIQVFQHDWNDEETITTWHNASSALAAFGQIALPELLEALLQNEDSIVRQGVIDALGQLQDPQALPALITMLEENDHQVRRMVVEALGSIGDPRAIEPLMSHLHDGDIKVRREVCYALGDIGTNTVLEPLLRALEDTEASVRSAAIVNLGRMLGISLPRRVSSVELDRQHRSVEVPDAVQRAHILSLIIEALKDVDGSVRASAARALGQLGDESVLPDLLWLEQNDSAYAGANKVKDAAKWAIQRIKERYQEH